MLIYVADVPTYFRDILKQRWADVDFANNRITVRAFNKKTRKAQPREVLMTPRLSDELRRLWGTSDRNLESAIISRAVDGCNEDFDKVRTKAGVEGLMWPDIRRIGAWRWQQALKDAVQVAARLGMSLNHAVPLLRVDHAAAEQEISSQNFKKFLEKQLGAPQPQNGNRQKSGSAEKGQHGGAHNVKWTPELEEEFVTRYEDVLPKIQKKDSGIPSDVLAKLLLPGNQASDVARDYVAELMGVESNYYLITLLTRVRKRRKSSALHSSLT